MKKPLPPAPSPETERGRKTEKSFFSPHLRFGEGGRGVGTLFTRSQRTALVAPSPARCEPLQRGLRLCCQPSVRQVRNGLLQQLSGRGVARSPAVPDGATPAEAPPQAPAARPAAPPSASRMRRPVGALRRTAARQRPPQGRHCRRAHLLQLASGIRAASQKRDCQGRRQPGRLPLGLGYLLQTFLHQRKCLHGVFEKGLERRVSAAGLDVRQVGPVRRHLPRGSPRSAPGRLHRFLNVRRQASSVRASVASVR